MSTAASLITKALYLNGAASPINPASTELRQLAFEALIDMLVDWDALGINLGVTIPTNQADELNNPPDTNQVIQYNLSVISAPLFQLEAKPVVVGRAMELYDDMQINYSIVPYACPPETLPIGSGNQQNVNGARYYYTSEDCLTDVNGIPLLGGVGS